MKKIILFNLLLLLVFSGNLFAQKPFPLYEDNPEWRMSGNHIGGNKKYITMYESNIEICGFCYSKVNGSQAYYRIEDSRVYLRMGTNCSDREYLAYDFNLQPGDSVYVGFNLSYVYSPWPEEGIVDSAKIKVLSVDTVDYFGIRRKTMYVQNERVRYRSGYDYWIEGIGSLTHPFYPIILDDINGCPIYYSLICYKENNISFYQSSWYDCEIPFSVQHNNIPDDYIKIFPNPFNDYTNISVNTDNIVINKIEIYTSIGIKYFEKEVKTDYLLEKIGEELVRGVYFIKIFTDKGVVVRKIIRQ